MTHPTIVLHLILNHTDCYGFLPEFKYLRGLQPSVGEGLNADLPPCSAQERQLGASDLRPWFPRLLWSVSSHLHLHLFCSWNWLYSLLTLFYTPTQSIHSLEQLLFFPDVLKRDVRQMTNWICFSPPSLSPSLFLFWLWGLLFSASSSTDSDRLQTNIHSFQRAGFFLRTESSDWLETPVWEVNVKSSRFRLHDSTL